jgi:hypothetical protein
MGGGYPLFGTFIDMHLKGKNSLCRQRNKTEKYLQGSAVAYMSKIKTIRNTRREPTTKKL